MMDIQRHLEVAVRDEIAFNRRETAQSALQARQELGSAVKSAGDSRATAPVGKYPDAEGSARFVFATADGAVETQ